MADQTLSPSGSPAKIGIPAKAVPGKRAVIYTRVSTGDQHAETQLYDLRELAKQRRICSMPLLDESRKRFLAKFFVVGACAPAVWGLSEVSLAGSSTRYASLRFQPRSSFSMQNKTFAGNTLFFGNRGTHERCLVCVL